MKHGEVNTPDEPNWTKAQLEIVEAVENEVGF